MTKVDMPREELGRMEAFLSYESLPNINSIDPTRQFRYATKEYYTSSVEFHNRALMFGIGENSARAICNELIAAGYIGLVEIETINPKIGINKVRGRPIISV